jgi:hypothetical protein
MAPPATRDRRHRPPTERATVSGVEPSHAELTGELAEIEIDRAT